MHQDGSQALRDQPPPDLAPAPRRQNRTRDHQGDDHHEKKELWMFETHSGQGTGGGLSAMELRAAKAKRKEAATHQG